MIKKYKKYALALASVMVIGSVGFTGQVGAATPETAPSSQNEKQEEAHRDGRLMERWQSLKAEEKAQVYTLFEQRIKDDNAVLDKLVELGIVDSDKADRIKQYRLERFEKQKENGEFPTMHQPSHKRHTRETEAAS